MCWSCKRLLVLVLGLAGLLALACGSDEPAGDAGEDPTDEGTTPSLAERLCDWVDYPDNPLIEPPGGEFLIGDPTVVPPDESPDAQWHLFANSLLGVHHYLSGDGVEWTKTGEALFGFAAFRPFVYRESGDGTVYYLLFEQFDRFDSSEMRIAQSTDLFEWSQPVTLLQPELEWEQTTQQTIGNPYLRRESDEYWLYYSADGVRLEDTGFSEPRVIGLARADALDGPWTREAQPIIEPSAERPWQNRGAGSIKLLDERVSGRLIALNNGIYESDDGVSGSAIAVLSSEDGVHWEDVCGGPVIAPEGDGWKRAFVYAFDTTRVGDEIWLYYNARDGWAQGTERIGLARLHLPASP